MRFAFSEEQVEFARVMRELLERRVTSEYLRAAVDRRPDPAVWHEVGAMGVIGMLAPEEYGGSGGTEVDLVLLLIEAGRVCVPFPLSGSAAISVPLLRDHAPRELRDTWLPRLVRGEGLVPSGSEGYIMDADLAGLLLVGSGREMLAVDPSEAVIAPRPTIDPILRVFSVSFDRSRAVRLDAEAALAGMHRGAFATAAHLVGVTEALIAKTAAYAKQRAQFGKPIGSFQAVKHHLATALMKLEFARPLVYGAAYSLANAEPDVDRDVSAAKAAASEAGLFAAKIALQVHGAIGYTEESDLHFWMKRVWFCASAYGGATFHRARIADAVLGKARPWA